MFIPKDEIIDGEPKYIIAENGDGTNSIELANIVEQEGTELNAQVLATCLGFASQTTTFNADGSITETDGTYTKRTVFNNTNNSVTETLTDGTKTITKTTTFNSNGTITESVNLGGN